MLNIFNISIRKKSHRIAWQVMSYVDLNLLVRNVLKLVLLFGFTINAVTAEEKEPDELKKVGEEITQQLDHPEVEAYQAFGAHLFPYEPIYFLYGTDPVDNVKFQVSLAIRAIPTTKQQNRLDGFYFAYTQRSFWDLDSESAPFFDSSYMPELFYRFEGFNKNPPLGMEFQSYQVGYQHESNGRDGLDSRSIDMAYIDASWLWNLESDWHLNVRPRIWTYLSKEFQNKDIEEYRGNFRFDINVGSRNGIYFATRTNVGSNLDKGSFELNVTYPLDELISVPLYFMVQYYAGYGETLMAYDQRFDRWLVGFSAIR